jgi:hypothetical protein
MRNLGDSDGSQVQTVTMSRKIFLSLVLAGAALLSAQELATTPPKNGSTAVSTSTLPTDPVKLAAAVNASYYHPDELSSIGCTVSVDWPSFFGALKVNPAADRLAALQGLKIHSRAVRGKTPEVTFDWAGGPLDTKEQLEGGMRQTMGGFYQMYWSLFASSLIRAAEVTKVEPLPDGSEKIYASSQGISVVITADQDGTPTHYVLDSSAMKGTMDLHYVLSPNPVPGDDRRISDMHAIDQFGASTMNVELSTDYQTVDGFYVPKNVTFNIVGAYSFKMEFSGCSVSKLQ